MRHGPDQKFESLFCSFGKSVRMSGPPRPFPTNYVSAAAAPRSNPITNDFVLSQYIMTDEVKSRRILELAFKLIPPTNIWKTDFLPYQMLYRAAPQCFSTNGEPHQDNMADKLHISVLLRMPGLPGIRFHLNGYMAGGRFTMTECEAAAAKEPMHLLCVYDNVYDKNHPLYEKKKAERIALYASRKADGDSISSHE